MNLVEILPLGGAGEIGRNCTLLIQGDDMLMIDCGISFPNEEMHGVDVVIPDFAFVEANKHKLKGIILTHAHEDHVGALSHLLRTVKTPIYATEFTHAMIRPKLEERLDTKELKFVQVRIGDIIPAGGLKFEFVRITHSIPDTCCIGIHTDHGIVLFTADFKFDFTPVDGKLTDIKRLTELGDLGVVCLLSDSTNVDRPGFGPSERIATDGFRQAFGQAKGRILITMFASNIHRMQQAMDVAAETGRKVATAGRRMEQTIDICTKLGYINVPKGVRIRLDQADDLPPEQVIILTTGSQGEPLSALVQMSKDEYSRMRVREGDTILYSARPIPGNEAAIWRTVNRLFGLGAIVVYDASPQIHVSGHAYQDELKMMINLTRPFYLAPVHGEPRHQHTYCEMAKSMGHEEHRMFKLQDGFKLILDATKAWTEQETDGATKWIDRGGHLVEYPTVRERETLADYGVIFVSILITKKGVEDVVLEARGYSGSDVSLARAKTTCEDVLKAMDIKNLGDDKLVQKKAMDSVTTIIQRQASLRPMIVASIVRA